MSERQGVSNDEATATREARVATPETRVATPENLGRGELGHGLGSLGDGMLGQLTREDEPDGGLDLDGGAGGSRYPSLTAPRAASGGDDPAPKSTSASAPGASLASKMQQWHDLAATPLSHPSESTTTNQSISEHHHEYNTNTHRRSRRTRECRPSSCRPGCSSCRTRSTRGPPRPCRRTSCACRSAA